jgi:uncharacterized protein (DUF1778 family)
MLGLVMKERAARLDIRTTEAAKARIEDAANCLGVTTSSFILECAVEKATRVLQKSQSIHLNQEEAQRFLDFLENPPEPNIHLKKLFKKFDNKNKK